MTFPMYLVLPPEVEKLINDRVDLGRYPSPWDVVAAVVVALDRQESSPGEFEVGEWDALLDAGECSGSPLDGDQAFAELFPKR